MQISIVTCEGTFVNNKRCHEHVFSVSSIAEDVGFSFNNQMYKQVDGVAMGSPLGPTLAKIFMGYLESRIPADQMPFYKRYVDDTSTLVESEAEANKFRETLNNMHPIIRFTMEGEEDSMLAFLDCKLRRAQGSIRRSVYCKKTFTGVYTQFDSFAPMNQN